MIPPSRPGVDLLHAALKRRMERHADKVQTATRIGRAIKRARVDPVDALAGLLGEVLERQADEDEEDEDE